MQVIEASEVGVSRLPSGRVSGTDSSELAVTSDNAVPPSAAAAAARAGREPRGRLLRGVAVLVPLPRLVALERVEF